MQKKSFLSSDQISAVLLCLRSLIQNLLIHNSIHESISISVPSGVHEMGALLMPQSEDYQ